MFRSYDHLQAKIYFRLKMVIRLFYFSVMMVGISECLCSAGGRFWIHSIEFLVWIGNKICRFVLILSQIMKINIITLTSEIYSRSKMVITPKHVAVTE
jgi:hypothetical protein